MMILALAIIWLMAGILAGYLMGYVVAFHEGKDKVRLLTEEFAAERRTIKEAAYRRGYEAACDPSSAVFQAAVAKALLQHLRTQWLYEIERNSHDPANPANHVVPRYDGTTERGLEILKADRAQCALDSVIPYPSQTAPIAIKRDASGNRIEDPAKAPIVIKPVSP